MTAEDAKRQAAAGDSGDMNEEQRRAEWNALYARAIEHETWSGTLQRCLAGLAYQNEAKLSPEAVARLREDPFVASVSRLERFAACPFAHFVEYTLGLEPRREADMGDVDLGQLCHAVLEKFVQRLVEDDRPLADLEDDQIAEQVELRWPPKLSRNWRARWSSARRGTRTCSIAAARIWPAWRWQRDAARAGRFRPRWVEHPFGYSDDCRLVLTTPAGRTVYLRGRIDRVDVAELGDELLGMVIDYKRTTHRRLDLTQVYYGLTLQLVGYLLALQQAGHSLTGRPIRPVAALYLPLLEPFQTVSHPDDAKRESYRLRGIADASVLSALDGSVCAGGQGSLHI